MFVCTYIYVRMCESVCDVKEVCVSGMCALCLCVHVYAHACASAHPKKGNACPVPISIAAEEEPICRSFHPRTILHSNPQS